MSIKTRNTTHGNIKTQKGPKEINFIFQKVEIHGKNDDLAAD